MRFPLIVGLVALGVVAMKVMTVGSVLVGLMVLGPVLLGFAIVAAVLVGLVGAGILAMRFLLFCLRGFKSPPRTAMQLPPLPPRIPRGVYPGPPKFVRAAPAAPGGHAMCHTRSGKSWSFVAVSLMVLCVVVISARLANRHQVSRSRADKQFWAADSTFKHGKITVRPSARVRAPIRITRPPEGPPPRLIPPKPPEPPILPFIADADDNDDTDDDAVCTDDSNGNASASASTHASTSKNRFRERVKGVKFRADVDEAKEEVLSEARNRVLVYLKRQNPPVDWEPTVDYIRDYLVKEWSEDKKDPPKEMEEVGPLHRYNLLVEVSPDDYSQILQQERHEHMKWRLLPLAKGLGVLVALLALVAGYIRVDEWTKGYYTGWLRVAAVGVLAAVIAGLWVFHRTF
jgi:hypothetical protein